MNDRKFSFFLQNFLKDRNLSVAELARQLKISNKNAVIRILNDKASVSNVKSFADKLKSSFDLSRDEISALDNALSYKALPKTVVSSRQTLASLFEVSPAKIPNQLKCTLKNACECNENIYLFDEIHNILNNSPEDEFEIYIESVNTLAFTEALYKVSNDGIKRSISIQQFFQDTDDITENIHQLYTLMRLSRLAKYTPYTIPSNIMHSNRLNIINRTKNKAYLINIYSKTGYTYLEMDVEGTSYKSHTMKEFQILRDYSSSLRYSFTSAIESLPQYLDLMLKMDALVSYEMKASPCFAMLPFDIQHSLYEESNYLGMGLEHPAVQKMYSIMQSREKALYAPGGVTKYLILDKNGVEKFLKTGRTSDHVTGLRSLTCQEARYALKKLIDNENTNIYLIKEHHHIAEIECVLFETNSLLIYDPSLGYWDNYSDITVKNKKMLRIMRDFIIEEIIKNRCYSIEETKQILEDMI